MIADLQIDTRHTMTATLPAHLSEFALDAICYSLKLSPPLPWKVSLGYAFLPTAARRAWMLDADTRANLKQRLVDDDSTSGDNFLAGWLLIFDSWCHARGYRPHELGSNPDAIETLTQGSTHPALRIAHAIRGLAYNAPSARSALSKLLDDNACTNMLSTTGWRISRMMPQRRHAGAPTAQTSHRKIRKKRTL
jgi:hypothetical protein